MPNPKLLSIIRNRFLTLRDMAAELGQFPEFEGIGHPTLVRWLNIERSKKPLPRRARRAIELLSAKQSETLRISFHDMPAALPLMILEAQTKSQSRAIGFSLERVDAVSGVEALSQIGNGKADVALAWEDVRLLKTLEGNCAALCGFVEYDLEGLFLEHKRQPIKTRLELRGVKFGFPATSAVGEFLRSEITFERGKALSPKSLHSAKEAASALSKGRIDYLIGWRPWLTQAKKALGESSVGGLSAGLLSPIRLALFVSKRSKKGVAILRFLRRLAYLAQEGNLLKTLQSLDDRTLLDLARRIGIETEIVRPDVIINSIQEYINGYGFRLNDVDLDVLFCIWSEAEVMATI